jgi:ATP-dependent DNA helicase RecG
MNLDTPVQYLKGVGPKMAAKLQKLGIEKTQDLIFHFPRLWNDLSQITAIKQLRIGNLYNIKAKIISISNNKSPKKWMNITNAIVVDDNGDEINIRWFNQPFLTNILKAGDEWIFSGKVEWDFKEKVKIITSPIYELEAKIIPVYPLTEGVTNKYIRKLITNIFQERQKFDDHLPEFIPEEENLVELNTAIVNIHFPKNVSELSKAKNRLAFDEIFSIVLKMMIIKKELVSQKAPEINPDVKALVKLTKSLPYNLTNAQRKTSWEIIKDLAKKVPMNRLLEGDVGSGKTIVAALAALNTSRNGYRVVWMAPTEILATQHYENISKLLCEFDCQIGLVTANNIISTDNHVKASKKNIKVNALNSDIIIGTHALIQDDIEFENLGLVIIDEQHRFGVAQRAKLTTMNHGARIMNHGQNHNSQPVIHNSNFVPHFLSMTATPIPRTLALSLYGDLEISVLDEMPPGRQKVETLVVDPQKRSEANDFVRREVACGRQAFVICPLIDENNKKQKSEKLFEIEKKTVLNEYRKLSVDIFPEFKVGYLHGKMKPREKEKIMNNFKNKKIDILVATSVIEVGINVPNATVMMIENADNFGLSQLHQFRGRVGRGKDKAYCFLLTSGLAVDENRRLKAMIECSDGFRLAEQDLLLRGPGEFTGSLQHGLPDLKMASLTDTILINKARSYATRIVNEGIEKYPKLIKKVKELGIENHLE